MSRNKFIPLSLELLSIFIAINIPWGVWLIIKEVRSTIAAFKLASSSDISLALFLIIFNVFSLCLQIYLVPGLFKLKKRAYPLFFFSLAALILVKLWNIYPIIQGSSRFSIIDFVPLIIVLFFTERVFHYRDKFVN